MHVLITADTIGGVWTYTQELVCGLLDRGHRVTLVSFGRLPTPAQTRWMRGANLAFYPTHFPLEWMQHSEEGIEQSTKYLAEIVRITRPEVLHFSQYCYGALNCGMPKIVVAHSDVVSWWQSTHESECEVPRTRWFEWYIALVSSSLLGAERVVAPSEWMLKSLQQNYSAPTPARVIYNGRKESKFGSAGRKSDCVLSVGRLWDEAKQIKLLLARKQCVPVRIAGSSKHPDNASAAEPPHVDNVQICGEQDEAQLRTLYSDSACYAATSRYEPFGLAPVEAALSRCALIANDLPVFHELWGDSAFYFKRNDPDALAEAVRIAFEDSRLRSRCADLAFERARARFSSERMVSEYEQLYREVTGKGAWA